jgi:class 3 adenylate cyclase
MEPQIRYVTSADGTRIAVSTAGHGRPLVILPTFWLNTSETYWQVPESRANLERLVGSRKVVTYDNRGYGLSDRDVTDFSLEARVGDLSAVVANVGSPIDLLASQGYAGPAAISYTATHPDRVGRLCLPDGIARGRDIVVTPRQRALQHLIEVDWELYVQTQVLVTFGWSQARSVAESLTGSVTAETFLASVRAAREDDVTELLPEVQCPTLVTYDRNGQFVSIGTARRLVAAIPNGRLALVEPAGPWTLGDDAAMRIIEAFLDEATEAPKGAPLPSGTAIILFADIADSTALTERLGDAPFRKKARELDGALRAAIRERGGTPVEGPTLGDGVLAVFTSAREAIEAGLACASAGASAGLPLHLGIHAGDVTRERDADGRDNVYGGAVNIASRIAGLSAAGEVLVSETVRSLARTSAGVGFDDRGEQALKGVGEAVRVWAVAAAASQQTDKPANQGT